MRESCSTGQLRQTRHWPDIWTWACYRRLGKFSPIYNLPVDFSIVVHIGLTLKYLRNGIKLLLNSEPFPNITVRGLGYIGSHTSLNIWDILAEYWSMIRTSAISNHPIVGSIKVVHSNWSYFVGILFSGYLTLDIIMFVSMRYTHTVFHGLKVSASLAGGNPYLAFHLLNLWQYL